MISQFINEVIYYLPIEFVIVSAEVCIVSCIYRVVLKEWWWANLFKSNKKKPWSFSVDSTGWKFEGSGHDPVKTFRKVVRDIRGPEKPLGDEIRDTARAYIRNEARNRVRRSVSSAFAPKEMKVDKLGNITHETTDVMQQYVDSIMLDTLKKEFGRGKQNGSDGKRGKHGR